VEEGERVMRFLTGLALAFAVSGSACSQDTDFETQNNPSTKQDSISDEEAFEKHPLYSDYKSFEDRYLKVKIVRFLDKAR